MSDMRTRLLALAVSSLIGCGDVKGLSADAARVDSTPIDAAYNPCAPDPCLLADDFSGAALDTARWGTAVGGGATVTQANGKLTIRLPAAANAFADVYSQVGFPVGASFEASVTFSAGQFYDHKGIGFSSMRVDSGCNVGETDAAMFRGQDGDSYVETKVATAYSCTKATTMYPAGTSKLQIVRAADQVTFRQNGIALPSLSSNVPAGLLPIRFSAYTFTLPPGQPVQIDVDDVFVRHP
jgi:hypothetical protein